MSLPTNAPITQEFGNNFIYNGRWAYGPGGHNGMDFGIAWVAYGCPSISLTIEFTGWDSSGYGNLVIGRDQYGYRHWFAHNNVFYAKKGQTITIGTPIAQSGNSGFSTAPHLHWGVQLPGHTGYTGYVNPRNWPGFTNDRANMVTDQQYNDLKADRDRYAEAFYAELYWHMRGQYGSRDEHRLRLGLPWNVGQGQVQSSGEWQANVVRDPWWKRAANTDWKAKLKAYIDSL